MMGAQLTREGASAADWNAEQTVHGKFEEIAAQYSERAALVFPDGCWTYRQLNARANRIARCIDGLGVAPGSRIAVCLDRSPDLIACLIAILKSSCAYVPVDTTYPPERVAFLLRDIDAPVVFADTANGRHLGGTAAKVFSIDTGESVLAEQKTENVSLSTTSNDVCYVMYTSGTTGVPKGVMAPHRGVTRLVCGADYATFSPDEVFLQLSPVSFDASTFEIWGSLLNGGSLALPRPGVLSLEEIGRAIRAYGVTTAWLTAGLFHQMVEHRLHDLAPLRQLLAGGDVLSPKHVRRAVEGLPGCRLINGYGPTETTTFACCHTIAPEDLDGRAIPIGRPIHRTEVHLLDSERRPVADGENGEIFIGGDGVACGYLHQPEMTAARFVTHPLAGEPWNRLYRTGDIGRRREDGTIEFRGRLDDQVKISGHRIEPAEIQAALSQLPGVREAEVVAITVNSHEKRLVAYVVPAKNGEAGAATVRQQLSQRLPDFMIPSVFQVVEELPISPNGKVDHAKLPAPHWEKGTGAVPAEGGNVESIVRAVWQKVLRVAEFGANENFFDLGGNSLMLIEAHAELERALGRELSLITLFEYPSVAALVPQMEGRSATHSTLRAAEQRARRQREALHRIRQARCGVRADQ